MESITSIPWPLMDGMNDACHRCRSAQKRHIHPSSVLLSPLQELFLTLQGLVGAHYTEAQLEQVSWGVRKGDRLAWYA